MRLQPFRDEFPELNFLQIVQIAAATTDLSATGFYVGMDEFVHTCTFLVVFVSSERSVCSRDVKEVKVDGGCT
jgi:hypothetical protein